jgi:bacterial leucyl aminopeptidase
MKHTAILLALGFLGACTTYVDNEVGDDFSEEVRADSADIWVTIGSDAIDVVREALQQGELDGEIESFDRTDEATVLRLRESQVPQLTRLMHDHLNRCGGYVVHDTFKQAVEALDDPRSRVAAEKTFVSYTIDNAAVVNTLISGMQEPQIRGTITTLSTNFINRYYTTQSGVDSAVWIRDLWQGMAAGRSDVTVQLYSHSWAQPSVIMTITGDTYPSEVVVLGAHLDSTAGYSPGPSTSAPGADDDASGVATLSEVARVALASGFKPRRTVKFMAYAAEEVGLRGSGAIAAEHVSQGINVIGVLQLDMTNYKGSSQDIVLISDNTNAAQNQFVGNLVDAYLGLSWTHTQCGYACSDHASWHSRGFPASFPFEALFSNYNPYIHTGNDTLANSGGDAQHALKFAKLAGAYMAELAKGDFDGGGGEPPPPPPPPPPGPVTETFSGSVSQGENKHYGPFSVEPGSTFTAQITGSGDADLYVKFGSPPTTSSYNCRPYLNGSNETCNLTVPSGQTEAYVMVRGYTSATYTLTVTYTPNSGGTPPGPITETFSGSVAQGENKHYGGFSVTPGSTFTAAITGSGDADLYVKFGSPPTTSSYDCRPYKTGSSETCTLTVPAGQSQAYVMVRGYTSATYTLTVTYTSP